MSQEFLNGPNVIAFFEEMGGKAMPEGMTARRLCNPSGLNGALDGILKILFADVVTADFAAARID